MTQLILVLIGIVLAILTALFLSIPVEMIVGTIKAFGHGKHGTPKERTQH